MSKFDMIKIALNYVGPKMSKVDYAAYKKTLSNFTTSFNKKAQVNTSFLPTKNRVVNFYGGAEAETLTVCQSSDFVDKVLGMIKSKKYEIPDHILYSEEHIPSWSGIGATNFRKNIIFNPRAINRLNARCIFHEIGHLLHENLQHRNGFIVNFLRRKDKYLGFLKPSEKENFINDIKRAYSEGHYKGMPYEQWIKDKLFGFGQADYKAIKNFRKNAAERQARYPLTDRYEFVADVFSLKIQGFNFSSEIESMYKKLGGPNVKEIFTQKELDDLIKLQKQIRKKTLSDYNISFTA